MNSILPDFNRSTSQDGFSQQLREMKESFEDRQIGIFGPGFEDVLGNDAVWEEYCEAMMQGLQDDDKENFRALMQNAKQYHLSETIGANIVPITSLTMPMLRKVWPRLVVNRAIPTTVQEKPKFTVHHLKPYFTDASGNKHYLPEGLDQVSDLDKIQRARLATGTTPSVGLPDSTHDVLTDANEIYTLGFTGTTATGMGTFRYTRAGSSTLYGLTGNTDASKNIDSIEVDNDFKVNGIFIDEQLDDGDLKGTLSNPTVTAYIDSGAYHKVFLRRVDHADEDPDSATLINHYPMIGHARTRAKHASSHGESRVYAFLVDCNLTGTDQRGTDVEGFRSTQPDPFPINLDTRVDLLHFNMTLVVKYVEIQATAANTDVAFGITGNTLHQAFYSDGSSKTTSETADKGTVAGGTSTLRCFLEINREKGTYVISKVDHTTPSRKVKGVAFEGYLKSQMNNAESATQVNFDLVDKEVNIPTGPHIVSPLPEEFLTDLLRMFEIDGVAKVIDYISMLIALRTDMDGYRFLDLKNAVPTDHKWQREFDVHPPFRYNGSPTEWRGEIRGVLDNLAQQMMNDVYFTKGQFVILGNPIDTHLIPNIEWAINADAADEMSGVDVNYQLGVGRNQNFKFLIVSAQNAPPGDLHLLYIPTMADQKTYVMYPYSFTVNNNAGYRDPNNQNVPAIVAHKRYIYERYTPCMGRLTVKNNDGNMFGTHNSG